MYSLSKSVPRGYEYLSSTYSRVKPHKADRLQEYPPAPYYHHSKNFTNVSPLRNKQKLIEARTYRSPVRENEKNVLKIQNKLEKNSTDLKSFKAKFNQNSYRIKKISKEN